MSGTPVSLRGDDLLWVQRRYLDLLAERDALRQELTEAQMATGVAVAERNVALALLRDARPFVHDVSLYNFGARGVAAFAVLKRLDALIGGDHA